LIAIFTIRRLITAHTPGDDQGATGTRRWVTTIGCARITIIAINSLGHTPIEFPVSVFTVAKIHGARVTVITISGLSAAYTKAAYVVFRTRVTVIATARVMTRHTFPCGRVTAVIGALVAIVATQPNTFASAGLQNTLIVMRAEVSVIAEVVVHIMHAGAGLTVTPIGRANITVITRSRRAATSTVLAEVGFGAEVAVVTWQRVREESAGPCIRITKVVGAVVFVIADHGHAQAFTFGAERIGYAKLTVVAHVVVIRINALALYTGLARAGVCVVANVIGNL